MESKNLPFNNILADDVLVPGLLGLESLPFI